MSSKRIEIFEKASNFFKKSLKFSENIFQMPRILKKSLAFFKKDPRGSQNISQSFNTAQWVQMAHIE
jgi:hypothetical protein